MMASSSPECDLMNAPRTIAAALACLCIAGTACTATQSSASELSQPPPTIGLGFEFESEPGSVRGVADVRAVEPEEIDTIVMVGDSITLASRPALSDRFSELGFDEVLIEAESGKRMTTTDGSNASGVSIVEFLAASDDDGDHSDELWVIALGTNDINQYGGVAELAAELDRLMRAVPADAALVWVDTYYRKEERGASMVNQVIADRVAARGNSIIAPWSAHAADAISSDGLHPTPQGREVFAGVVAATVATFLDA